MTPAWIEPATFRFVAQHINHCATAVPFVHFQSMIVAVYTELFNINLSVFFSTACNTFRMIIVINYYKADDFYKGQSLCSLRAKIDYYIT